MSLERLTYALMTSAVFAFAMAASPAFACKGATSLLRDDFTDTDPAWNVVWPDGSSFQIGGGKLEAKANPGKWGEMTYEGNFFGAADACIDIVGPSVRDPANMWAGLLFESGDGAWYIPSINLNGTVGVYRVTGDGWLNPVPPRKFAGLKSGADAKNTLRVVWKGPPARGSTAPPDQTVQLFINDQEFIKFKVPPNANRKIGIAVQSEGNVFQLSNLSVTR
jgi:hypothetical protein